MSNAVVEHLQDLRTIRLQAQKLLALAREKKLLYFDFNERFLPLLTHYVCQVMKENYPTLDIPYHSRWRHFEAAGSDWVQKLRAKVRKLSNEEQGKIFFELVIVSVFLDAGAGKHWQYYEKESGKIFTRSEGLALASLNLYLGGGFSQDPQQPFRVDNQRLCEFSEAELINAFQVSKDNPLEGIGGRLGLLHQVGAALTAKPEYFGKTPRLGNFYTYICSLQKDHSIPAREIFKAVLNAFNEIWPKRIHVNGIYLGDVGLHRALKTSELASECIPFHKLSQWLTYSLIEPLEWAGITVTEIHELTGLPEYRNGGLFIDMGVLQIKNPVLFAKPQDPCSEAIVEWRGLTVALLDELALSIRAHFNLNEANLPLAKILQGGTWEAGRRIAKEKREDGSPPIQIISDGTIF